MYPNKQTNTSYASLVENIKTTLLSNAFINTVHVSSVNNLNSPLSGGDIVYPYAFLVLNNIELEPNNGSVRSSATFDISIADVYVPGRNGEAEENVVNQIISDCTKSLGDILAFYTIDYNGAKYTGIDEVYVARCIPFYYDQAPVAAGINAQITFRFKQAFNLCNWPSRS